VEQLYPTDGPETLARVGGAPQQQFAQLTVALAPKPGEVDDAAKRVQRLRSADVVGRLLAPDVLLAGSAT